MNIAPGVLAVVVLTMVASMVGCASNEPFRSNVDSVDQPGHEDKKAVIESHADYKLGFVEFDDQGWFWDKGQRIAVEQMIKAEAGIAGSHAPARTGQGIILVAFVHGWKDNSSYDGDGVQAFRNILKQLSVAEQAQKDHSPRKVVGVYVGWRGLSAEWEPFKELSFWERKETAHKVGGYGAMTELLVDLETIQQESLASLPKEAPRTELIIIGHSLGGAAVYSALGQIVTERFVDSVIKKGERLKPLGDQVILLNPAFEALRYYDLNQMALAICAYPADQRPVLSIFTSRGDWATHYVFPISRFFATIFESNRTDKQRRAGLDAVGWYEPFITHQLVYSADSSFGASPTTTLNPTAKRHEFHNRAGMEQSVDHIKFERAKWHPNAKTPKTYNFDDSILKPIDGFRPGDPFLVVSVDRQIMEDHTDIANPVLINFLREYIQFCQPDVHDHSK